MYEVGRCRLRELLKERKMTQAELARRTGIDRKQINDYINKRDIVGVMGLGILRTIAEALGLESPYEIYEMRKLPE
ncbi:helix-turn-helix transcriptional regulator [Paenibacillus polymyxa]|uniref:helix-turn-helix domain-containing protein n=1 Tax=Paenibacillus polymyxa TaxID=1406 RepID=UPI001F0D1BC9|nr:helix-turn-helix transcriptional regulator [Paenibacillus polymyxa]UMR34004.1 helix-turn-helix transcriptional regulator [Paenibacillus polymyxa]